MGEVYRPVPEEQMEQLNKPEQQAAMDQRITQAEPPAPAPEMNKQSPNYQIEHKEAIAPQEFKETPQPDPGDNLGTQVQPKPGDRLEAQAKPKASDNIGAQAQDTPQFNQGNHPDCALQSARMVEAKQLGKDPGLDVYKNEAYKQGNYAEAGNKGGVKDMEKFSEQINDRPGLKAGYKEGATLDEIKTNLDQGKSVIAGVDAAKFYPELELPPNSGKHAIVVTGADKGPDGHFNITVNDPNDRSANRVVSENVFQDAWNHFDNRMIVVEKAGGKV